MIGTIKSLFFDRGFGFVNDQEGTRYFVHATALVEGATFDALAIGDDVEFEVQEDPKGARAMNVRPLGPIVAVPTAESIEGGNNGEAA